MYTVYCHRNKINDKCYIGITKKKPERRWQNGTGYKNSVCFYNAIKKHGWYNFAHEILYTNLTKKEAEEKEVLIIREWRTNERAFGYNIEGGGNLGKEVSEETRKKQSLSAKQRVEELGAPMAGKAYTNDEKIKMKQACSHRAKAVCQFSIDGLKLATFNSVSDAAVFVNGNKSPIIKCCKGNAHTAYGFVWRYNDR